MSSSKNFTCTVRGLCGRCLSELIDRRHSSHICIFDPALWTVAPLTLFLVQLSPLPRVNKCTVYTYTVWKRGGGHGVLGLRQISTCRKVPLKVNLLNYDDNILHILHCLLWALSFYCVQYKNNCCSDRVYSFVYYMQREHFLTIVWCWIT